MENGALTVGSLFSGIGAFDLAFERSGFAPLWQCEIDKSCLKLLASKWPAVPRHDDVTTFDPGQHPCPTVVVFGSPCQDLSVAGKRAGMAGERSGLFFYAARIIKHFVGRGLEFAVWENVPGCLSSMGGRDFAAVLASMAECGAVDIGWRILDCQWFGLAQRRRRVFLVADFRGKRTEEILALSESLQGYPAPRRQAGESVAPTVRSGAPNGGKGHGARSGDSKDELIVPLTANPIGSNQTGGFRGDLDGDTYVLAHGQGNAEHVKDGDPSLTCNHEAPIAIRTSGNCGPFVQGDKTGALNCATDPNQNIVMMRLSFDTTQVTSKANYSNPQPGDPVHPLASTGHAPALAFQPRYYTRENKTGGTPTEIAATLEAGKRNGDSQQVVCFQSRIARNGRGQPEEICLTLNGTDAGETSDMRPLVATQYQVRRLTPGECERLMGLPPGWTDGFSDSTRYRMLGNSLAVPVAEWIAKRMAKTL